MGGFQAISLESGIMMTINEAGHGKLFHHQKSKWMAQRELPEAKWSIGEDESIEVVRPACRANAKFHKAIMD